MSRSTYARTSGAATGRIHAELEILRRAQASREQPAVAPRRRGKRRWLRARATPLSFLIDQMLRRTAVIVSLGTLLAAPAARAQDSTATAPAAAPRAVRKSWTSDRREFAVGDLISIAVDEYTLASANNRNDATDRRSRDASLEIRKPGGAITGNISAGVGTSNNGTSQQQGAASRENRFQGEISARVVAVDPQSGLLQLEAHKLVNVDKNQQQITVTGWARPQDVTASNTLPSSRLADAEVVYASKGSLGKPKGGPLSKFVSILWP